MNQITRGYFGLGNHEKAVNVRSGEQMIGTRRTGSTSCPRKIPARVTRTGEYNK